MSIAAERIKEHIVFSIALRWIPSRSDLHGVRCEQLPTRWLYSSSGSRILDEDENVRF